MSMTQIIAEFQEWLVSLPPDFLFLLLLPFLVAIVGILAHHSPPPRGERRTGQVPLNRGGYRPLSSADS